MNKDLKAGTDAQQSGAAEVPTSSQPCSNTFVSCRWLSWGINIANLLILLWLQTKFNFIESFIIYFVLVMLNYIHGLIKGKSLKNGS